MESTTKKTNNNLFKISLVAFAALIIPALLLMNSCSLPNDISNYMDKTNNKGLENQIFNENSNLALLENIKSSTKRSDYPNLKENEFANFKAIEALGFRNNFIYRSASPIDSSSERSTYADYQVQKNNIQNIINLENTETEAKNFPGYINTFYSKQNILFAPIEDNLNSEKSLNSINKIFNFINNSDGPILIHCKDGATKTGIVCALLQSLNIAGYDYLKAEYIKAYLNLYTDTNNVTEALNAKFRNTLAATLGLTNHNVIYTNLNKYAKIYFENCSIDKNIIENVKQKLSNSYNG